MAQFFARGPTTQPAPAGLGRIGLGEDGDPSSESSNMIWHASRHLSQVTQQDVPYLMGIIRDLQVTLELTRVAYNQTLQERDQKRQQLVGSEARLGEVQRVVQRYTQVNEPVVASDGYTYERHVIQQYLEECETSDTHAYSQQTKEILTSVLIPNQSLKRLVELLKSVKPSDVPVASQRSAIPPLGRSGGAAGGGGGGNAAAATASASGEQNTNASNANPRANPQTGKHSAIHASDLEASIQHSTPTPSDSNNNNAAASGGKDAQSNSKKGSKHEGGRPASAPNTNKGGDASTGADSDDNNNSSSRNNKGGDFHRGKTDRSASGSVSKLHPCLRVYGHCNFKDDCAFAKYPYDSCLNFIKGKCRYSNQCKELHVEIADGKYVNSRNPGNHLNNNPNVTWKAPTEKEGGSRGKKAKDADHSEK